MSHQVAISYNSLTIQVKAQCDTAVHSLCAIDKVLDRIHKTASKLESEKVVEYENYLVNAKNEITRRIEDFKAYLETFKNKSDYSATYQQTKQQIDRKAAELTNFVNDLTGSKLAVIDQMINEGLLNVGNSVTESMINKINGVVSLSSDAINKINQIDDISLRELVYREILNDNNISFDVALKNAQDEYDKLLGKKTEQVIEEYKEELKSNGISTEVLDKVKTIDEANAVANEAIADEKIRKETLRVIIKAIKDRGFIVDTKKNLKIDKERNIVKLVALKASGQTAEFEIQLNGKFMYHFDGYEGLACNKDITPFMEDLKNIYDINVLHEEVQWSNPDKIQTQKYQYVNKNKGTN